MIGIVCMNTASGKKARSAVRLCTNQTASRIAHRLPETNPASASPTVGQKLFHRRWPSVRNALSTSPGLGAM